MYFFFFGHSSLIDGPARANMWQNLGGSMSPKESRVKPTLVGPDFFVGTPSAVGSDLFGKLREAKR